MVAAAPVHKPQHTGDATIDRIQSSLGDVIAYLKSLVWAANDAWVDLAVDVTTSSTTLVPLLSTTISTSLPSSHLFVELNTGFGKPTGAGTVAFTVAVDGKDVRGTAFTVDTASGASNLTILARVPVTAGKHTVSARWLAATGSVRINAQSLPLNEYASLYAWERP